MTELEFNNQFGKLDLKNSDDVYEFMYSFWEKFDKKLDDLNVKYKALENECMFLRAQLPKPNVKSEIPKARMEHLTATWEWGQAEPIKYKREIINNGDNW